MQNQPTQPGPQPVPPQFSRGQASYVPRSVGFVSGTQPAAQAAPSMAEVAEAAQRIVQPGVIPNPITSPIPTGWTPKTPVASLDIVAPPRPQPSLQQVQLVPPAPQVQSAPQVSAQVFSPQPPAPQPQFPVPLPELPSLNMSLDQPALPAQPAPQPAFNPSLPTDLPNSNQALLQPYQSTFTGKRKQPKLTLPRVAAGVALFVFLVGGGFGFKNFQAARMVQQGKVSGVTATSYQDPEGGLLPDAIPHEDGNAPDVGFYRAPASYPRVLRIAKIKTEARVLPLGISPTGALKAPGNVFDVGWYKDSARPGEEGVTVIDGHKFGETKDGVFKEIETLEAGDTLELERGDGEVFAYTVKNVKTFDADKLDMSSVLVPYTPGKQGLNILTCGKFNKLTNQYEKRTVVYAEL